MPRRISQSQFRSQLRQAQNKQRQAIQKYNSEVRKFNAEQKRRVDNYNRAASEYNRAVNDYKRRRREYLRKLQSALQKLSSQSANTRYANLRRSATSLSTAYDQLDRGNADPFLSDLAERETANSVGVVNALLEDDYETGSVIDDLKYSRITDSLSAFSRELGRRWSGALFSLDSANPDAARHFCTSSREIIAQILNTEAPDDKVLAHNPNCQLTDHGTPTRRAKIQYCLERNGLGNQDLEDFMDANVGDLTTLFRELNSGAHGVAGKFTLSQLSVIKGRVEDSIEFICQVVAR